jgi:hypothetical protein
MICQQMTWGTMHPDLAINAAHCEVAPVGAEAQTVDDEVESGVMIEDTLSEGGKGRCDEHRREDEAR